MKCHGTTTMVTTRTTIKVIEQLVGNPELKSCGVSQEHMGRPCFLL
jgi:hypothetical protein